MNNIWKATELCQTKHGPVYGVTVDNNGYVYYTENDNVYRIHGDGENGAQLVINAKEADLRGIVWNNNILYICDYNHKILMYSLDTGILSALAGNGHRGHKGGNIKDATFYYPKGIAVDKNGDLYITECHCVRKINVSEGTVITVAGHLEKGSKSGPAEKARFTKPTGIAVSEDGSIYVADRENHCIRKIKDGSVSTIAGTPNQNRTTIKEGNETISFAQASFRLPFGVVLDDDGNLIVSDDNGVKKLNLSLQTVSTMQGAPQISIYALARSTRYYFGAYKRLLTVEQQNFPFDDLEKRVQQLTQDLRCQTQELQDTKHELNRIQDTKLELEIEYDQLQKDYKELQAQLHHSSHQDTNVRDVRYNDLNIDKSCILGEGASSSVYKATYAGISVAVKEFHHKKGADKLRKEFEKEIKILWNVSHPNIVSLIGTCNTSSDPFCIIMEYMDQGSLHDMLHEKKIKLLPQLKLDMMKQVALALQFVHHRGIIHGDIKSRNILVNKSWNVKICDFGISKLTALTVQNQSTIHYTPQYAAPEVFEDQIFTSSDIFSFGILLWEVFAEQIPHKDISNNKLIRSCDTLRPNIQEIQSDYPEVASLCQQCWSSDFHSRPDAAAVVEKLSLIKKALPEFHAIRFEKFITQESQWKEICLILDNSHKGDWKELGNALGLKAMELADIARRNKKSPARLMLEEWKHSQEATMKTFMEALQSIDQWSVIHIIEKMREEPTMNRPATIMGSDNNNI